MFFTKILRLLTLNNCQGWWLEPPKLPSLSVCFLFLFPVSLWKELSFFSCFFQFNCWFFNNLLRKGVGLCFRVPKKTPSPFPHPTFAWWQISSHRGLFATSFYYFPWEQTRTWTFHVTGHFENIWVTTIGCRQYQGWWNSGTKKVANT